MSASGTGDTAAAPGWLRRNRFWLPGAVVLGVLAFVLPYRDAVKEFVDRRGPSHPIDAGPGRWVAYEGSRWRLVGTHREDGLGKTLGGYLHDDVSLLVATYEVVPGPGTRSDKLDACRGRLTDARDRHWNAEAVPSGPLRERLGGLGTFCGSRLGKDFRREAARPGWPFRFRHVFVVPRDLPERGLRVEIALPAFETTPPGTYLRFTP